MSMNIDIIMIWSSFPKCYSEIYPTIPPHPQVAALSKTENGWKEGKKQERKWSTEECDWSDFAAEPKVPETEEGIFPETKCISNYTEGEGKKNKNKNKKSTPQNPWLIAWSFEKISIPSKQSSLSVFVHRSENCISPTSMQHCRTNSIRQSRDLPALHGHKEGCAVLSKKHRMQQEIRNGLGNCVFYNRYTTSG